MLESWKRTKMSPTGVVGVGVMQQGRRCAICMYCMCALKRVSVIRSIEQLFAAYAPPPPQRKEGSLLVVHNRVVAVDATAYLLGPFHHVDLDLGVIGWCVEEPLEELHRERLTDYDRSNSYHAISTNNRSLYYCCLRQITIIAFGRLLLPSAYFGVYLSCLLYSSVFIFIFITTRCTIAVMTSNVGI